MKKKAIWTVIFALILLLAATPTVFAKEVVSQDAAAPEVTAPETIEIEAVKASGKFTHTFYLKSTLKLSGVYITASELTPVDADTSYAIQPADITIVPSNGSMEVGTVRTAWVVNIANIDDVGKWEGTLMIEWDQPAPATGAAPISIAIKVSSLEVPQGTAVMREDTKLVVSGISNVGCDECPRSIVIHETSGKVDLTGLKVQTMDLKSEDTPEKIFPSSKITPAIIGNAGSPEVTFDFNYENAQAGKYIGKAWVSFDNAPDLEIPIEVYVKHGILLPFVVLCLGLLLAIAITQYIQKYRNRDLLMVRIENMEEALPTLVGKEHSEVFINTIERRLSDARRQITDQSVTDLAPATNLISEAEAFLSKWNRWQKDKAKFNTLVKRIQTLLSKIQTVVIESDYLRSFRLYLQNILDKRLAEDYAELRTLDSDITRIHEPAQAYLNLLQELIAFIDQSNLDIKFKERGEKLIEQMNAFETVDINTDVNVKIPEPKDFASVISDFEALKKEAGQRIALLADKDRLVQEIKSLFAEEQEDKKPKKKLKLKAKQALAIFNFTTWLTAIAILVMIGLDQYLSKADFGSFAHYRDMFLWGFGTGLTRDLAVKLVGEWGIQVPSSSK